MFRFLGHFLNQLAGVTVPRGEVGMETIDSEASLENCLMASGEQPLFVLKHSTRCPISTSALAEVRRYVEGSEALPVYINYVVEARAQSNELAERLGVRHESPQLLLVREGAVIWDTSHGGITASAMAESVRDLKGKS